MTVHCTINPNAKWPNEPCRSTFKGIWIFGQTCISKGHFLFSQDVLLKTGANTNGEWPPSERWTRASYACLRTLCVFAYLYLSLCIVMGGPNTYCKPCPPATLACAHLRTSACKLLWSFVHDDWTLKPNCQKLEQLKPSWIYGTIFSRWWNVYEHWCT